MIAACARGARRLAAPNQTDGDSAVGVRLRMITGDHPGAVAIIVCQIGPPASDRVFPHAAREDGCRRPASAMIDPRVFARTTLAHAAAGDRPGGARSSGLVAIIAPEHRRPGPRPEACDPRQSRRDPPPPLGSNATLASRPIPATKSPRSPTAPPSGPDAD